MADHAEEQEMEEEALEAIYDTHFEKVASSKWSLDIYPESGDPSDLDELNHVAVRLLIDLPADYPELSVPSLQVEIIKGLADEHKDELEALAFEAAASLEGTPSIFAVAEILREWLVDNNQKGLDDVSMHAQMMRKKKQGEKAEQKAQETFEAQVALEEITQAEQEELEVRKRREEGTPCNMENFLAWRARFEAEMAAEKENEVEDTDAIKKSNKKKEVDKTGRITGRQHFADQSTNLEALEAAAEQAERDPDEDLDDVDEELFDDDVDLDDLDFDSEDEEDGEVDI